jgi:hypothetical protein
MIKAIKPSLFFTTALIVLIVLSSSFVMHSAQNTFKPQLHLVNFSAQNPNHTAHYFVTNTSAPLQPFNINRLPTKKTSTQINYHNILATDVDTAFSGIKKLQVKGSYCAINVKTGKSDKLILHAYIGKITYKAKIAGKKIENTKDLLVKYELIDNLLKVWVDAQEPKDNTNYSKVNIEITTITIEVPSGTNMQLSNATGVINVNSLDGKEVELDTEFGTINATSIVTNLTLKSTSGNINLKQITGNVNCSSGIGNISGNELKGDVRLTTTSGSIVLKNLRGNADLHSSYGNQTLDSISGNVLSDCASGNFTMTKLKGQVNIKSSFGSQNFENIEGDIVSYSGSGNILISDSKGKLTLGADFGSIYGKNVRLTGNSEFKTSSGNIRLKILNPLKELKFNLQALSGSLNVQKESVKQKSEEKLNVGEGSILIKGISTEGNQEYY